MNTSTQARSLRRRRLLAPICAAALCGVMAAPLGCVDPSSAVPGRASHHQERSPGSPTRAIKEQFEGRVVPKNATKLRAPQNTFSVRGWSSDSSWIKIQDLAPDGEAIKRGEVVGRFEFTGKSALPGIEQYVQQMQAERDRAGLNVERELSEMKVAEARDRLEAERAGLDTLKQGVVSERDLRRFEITRDLAEFEAASQGERIESYRRAVVAEAAFHDQNVTLSEADLERYHIYEGRYTVLAPHDGIVRHGFYSWRNRKVEKGDGMPAGMHFASVARDSALAVEIFVPEHRYALIRAQERFVIGSPSSSRTFEARVVKVHRFPQEMGFVKDNADLPNAREKVYVLEAELLSEDYGDLSAGLDVKVTLP